MDQSQQLQNIISAEKSNVNFFSTVYHNAKLMGLYITSKDFREFLKNKNPLTMKIDQNLTITELKYLKSVYTVNKKQVDPIKTLLRENKNLMKILNQDVRVVPIGKVGFENKDFIIGYDQVMKKYMASSEKHNYINLWEKANPKTISEKLMIFQAKQQEDKQFYSVFDKDFPPIEGVNPKDIENGFRNIVGTIIDNTPSIKNQPTNISHQTLQQINQYIGKNFKLDDSLLFKSILKSSEKGTDTYQLVNIKDDTLIFKPAHITNPEDRNFSVLLKMDEISNWLEEKNTNLISRLNPIFSLGYNQSLQELRIGHVNNENNMVWSTIEEFKKSSFKVNDIKEVINKVQSRDFLLESGKVQLLSKAENNINILTIKKHINGQMMYNIKSKDQTINTNNFKKLEDTTIEKLMKHFPEANNVIELRKIEYQLSGGHTKNEKNKLKF